MYVDGAQIRARRILAKLIAQQIEASRRNIIRSRQNSEASMTVHSFQAEPDLRSKDAALAPPYRITALEQALKTAHPSRWNDRID